MGIIIGKICFRLTFHIDESKLKTFDAKMTPSKEKMSNISIFQSRSTTVISTIMYYLDKSRISKFVCPTMITQKLQFVELIPGNPSDDHWGFINVPCFLSPLDVIIILCFS